MKVQENLSVATPTELIEVMTGNGTLRYQMVGTLTGGIRLSAPTPLAKSASLKVCLSAFLLV